MATNGTDYSGTTWMTDLLPFIEAQALNRVKLPGSHDSATYGITANSAIGPDADGLVEIVSEIADLLGCITDLTVNGLISIWAKAQGGDTGDQLAAGIRYLDLRTAKRDDELWEVHTMYSVNVEGVLAAVEDFLRQNASELVILDFQHFYDMGEAEHEQLIGLIDQYLGDYLTDLLTLSPTSTVGEFLHSGCRAVIIYGHSAGEDLFWSSSSIDSQWPQATNISDLESFLENDLDERESDAGNLFALQGIIGTGDSTQYAYLILEGLAGLAPNGLEAWADQVTPQVAGWIEEWTAEDPNLFPKVNIVIADWVTDHVGPFCDPIIEMNIPAE